MSRYFVTTAIPYVNGKPHIGFALELVQADVLARHRRQRGDEVRLQTGTDDYSLKNVHSAEAEGMPTAQYVERVANRFASLSKVLNISFNDFIKTSSDPRHKPGVNKFWEACSRNNDFYRKNYVGLYCVGCELFYQENELVKGLCPEHGTPVEQVEENNWFFRLSRYQDQLAQLITNDVIRIEPETRKREVLAFIQSGLEDFSVSRSVKRARGWGIPVPGDSEQIIYVWFDALTNYITAPGYGSDEESFRFWWEGDGKRVHVIGKGIIRFHAVYWPAMLLSAGIHLPDAIFVHEYLTANGQKISKSLGNTEDPTDIVSRYGVDSLRWWLLRSVGRAGDTDYTAKRLVDTANEDLAHNIGNLVNRTVSMIQRYRNGVIPISHQDDSEAAELRAVRAQAPDSIYRALAEFDFRRAAAVVVNIGNEGNRYIESVQPWKLAKAEKSGAELASLDAVLAELVRTCRDIATNLTPFLPDSAAKIIAQLGNNGATVAQPEPIFPRLEVKE